MSPRRRGGFSSCDRLGMTGEADSPAASSMLSLLRLLRGLDALPLPLLAAAPRPNHPPEPPAL